MDFVKKKEVYSPSMATGIKLKVINAPIPAGSVRTGLVLSTLKRVTVARSPIDSCTYALIA